MKRQNSEALPFFRSPLPLFFPLPSRRRVQASACGPIVFIKARCHGIVTAVRLISVLTVRRCQPRRSRTLVARRRVPSLCILTRQNDTGAFLLGHLSVRFRSRGPIRGRSVLSARLIGFDAAVSFLGTLRFRVALILFCAICF